MTVSIDIPQAVRWHAGALRIIDQTLLPAEYREIDLVDVDDVVEAITRLRVRGAPAIGVAGALGLVASLGPHLDLSAPEFRARLEESGDRIRKARPTATNLAWAVDRLLRRARLDAGASNSELWSSLLAEATAILEEDREMCRRIGEHGLKLLRDGSTVLTHCNTGALATAGIGTALAPVYLAAERGLCVRVLATETRPLLQGSRLTAWELERAGIDVTVLPDGAAADAMRALGVDMVIVGADRIVANGDVANKVGTYGLAIAARHHRIPFYVAAPSSTFDFSLESGDRIPIEQRGGDEVRRMSGRQIAPETVAVYGAAFDVTPAELISGIITEAGLFKPTEVSTLRSRSDNAEV
ncbi:MAG: S-methyl-5-thioribose-1-phosphate isomerase [Gemmatimonadota bacterium]|nr:MAG: S-methyl-5-thioribose-1-phosphate isomerase [Gemmatimonadota bacterium]